MSQTQHAQLLGGWIDAPESDRAFLEAKGITCLSFNRAKQVWNVIVSPEAFEQLDPEWGRWIWRLAPVDPAVAAAFFQAIILDASKREVELTVRYRRPQYGDQVFQFTGYPEAGPEDFSLHYWGDHSLNHRYEDVVSVVPA